MIDYQYSLLVHNLTGPLAAIPAIFSSEIRSLLDVGCGNGSWLKAAKDFGIPEVKGVDGVLAKECFVDTREIVQHDFRKDFDLGRRFDAVLCLEVAEHLEMRYAETFIRTLTKHGDFIVFSAACPGQPGQHHVNCQWPAYWQRLFNQQGFVCSDALRWRIWNDKRIENWYRQNIFTARKDLVHAGSEARIEAVIHPDMFSFHDDAGGMWLRRQIEEGSLSLTWYLRTPFQALFAKACRQLRRPTGRR